MPYFFENENHYGQWRYLWHHDNRFLYFVPAIAVSYVWCQEDGATWHTYHATIDVLHQTLDGRLISRKGNVN